MITQLQFPFLWKLSHNRPYSKQASVWTPSCPCSHSSRCWSAIPSLVESCVAQASNRAQSSFCCSTLAACSTTWFPSRELWYLPGAPWNPRGTFATSFSMIPIELKSTHFNMWCRLKTFCPWFWAKHQPAIAFLISPMSREETGAWFVISLTCLQI